METRRAKVCTLLYHHPVLEPGGMNVTQRGASVQDLFIYWRQTFHGHGSSYQVYLAEVMWRDGKATIRKFNAMC
jgi:hypothetical protein